MMYILCTVKRTTDDIVAATRDGRDDQGDISTKYLEVGREWGLCITTNRHSLLVSYIRD